jgi:hypothetical protein
MYESVFGKILIHKDGASGIASAIIPFQHSAYLSCQDDLVTPGDIALYGFITYGDFVFALEYPETEITEEIIMKHGG